MSALFPLPFFRRPLAWWLALVLWAGLGVALWQEVVGWPLHLTQQLPGSPDQVSTVRLPAKYQASDWLNAVVLVRGTEGWLRRVIDKETLGETKAAGYAVKGRSLHYRTGTAEPVTVRLSWVFPRGLTLGLLLGSMAWLVALSWAENSQWLQRRDQLERWLGQSGPPRLALSMFALALITAVALRVFGFSFPVWANDTGSFFKAVVAVMQGKQPAVTPDRPFGYTVVMGLLLRGWQDLRAVVVAQSAATLVAGGCLGGLLWVASGRLFEAPSARAAVRVLGVLYVLLFTTGEAVVQREWAILAEGWVPMLLGVQALLAWLLMREKQGWSLRVLWWVLLSAAGVLTFFTKPNWGFALGVLPLPWLVACAAGHPRAWLYVARMLGGAVVLLGLFAAGLWYQQHCTAEPPLANLYYRARALVCWHVPMVRLEIDRRLRTELPSAERGVLEEMAQVMDGELAAYREQPSGVYPSLRYDADHLFFTTLPEAPRFRRLLFAERTRLCTSLFVEALKRHPGMYVSKVAGQMIILFREPYRRPNIQRRHIAQMLESSQAAAEEQTYLPEDLRTRYAQTLAVAQTEFANWPSAMRLAASEREVELNEWLTKSFPWCWGLPMNLLLLAAVWPAWRARVPWQRLWPVLALALWSAGSVFFSALSSAVTQGLDVQRYIELSAPLTLFSQVLWPLIGIALVLAARKGSPAGAAGLTEEHWVRHV